MDDDADAPDKDGNAFNDLNGTLIIQAPGYAADNTKVVLEAVISSLASPAFVSNGDIEVKNGAEILGTGGGLHANGDLKVGKNADVAGTLTATGEFDGDGEHAGTGSAPEMPIDPIHAIDYQDRADFILTSGGEMTDLAGTVLCPATADSCNEWEFEQWQG
jgi:hypothetical protein